MEGTDGPAALHQGHDGTLAGVSRLALLGAGGDVVLGTVVGLVGFHDAALAAHRREVAVAHRFADAVRHEPCGFQGHVQSAVKLVARNALLGRAEQVDRLQPDVQLDVAALEHGADLDGEGLAAGVALVEADAGGLAPHLRDALAALAMRAHRAFRPHACFEPSVGGFFVQQVRRVELGHDGLVSEIILPLRTWVWQV